MELRLKRQASSPLKLRPYDGIEYIYDDWCCCYCIRRGGCVIIVFVCLFVCLSVSNFAQKLPNGSA